MKKYLLIFFLLLTSNTVVADIIVSEFFPDPEGNDNAPMPDGEFIEIYNNGNNNTNLAGFYFKDHQNHTLYITDTTTINSTIIKAKDYLAVYTNTFSGFLNNEGFEEIKLYNNENLIDKVNYAESKEALSWSLVNNIWQYTLPTPNKKNHEQEPEMQSIFHIEAIENLGSDDEAEFGDMVKVRFHVYKGDTNKESIKLYIENDDYRITKTTKAKLYKKFTNYTLTLPLQIYPNCKAKLEDGKYYVKLGWTSESEEKDSFRIDIEGIETDNCEKVYVEKMPRKGTLTHKLIEYPNSAEIKKEFTITVELTNNDANDHLVDLYSYVYRGSKCYSASREANKKTVLVNAGAIKEFELKNIVNEAESGDYKLKVKTKRQDQKTAKQITEDIKLEKTHESEEKITRNIQEIQPMVILNPKTSNIVYESTDIKTKKLIPYFVIALYTIFLITLIIKKYKN